MITSAALSHRSDNHLEQKLGADIGEWDVAELVDAQQLVAGVATDHSREFVLLPSFNEFVDESRGRREANAATLLARRYTQCRGQMSLACAGIAEKQNRPCMVDVVAFGQFSYPTGGDLPATSSSC